MPAKAKTLEKVAIHGNAEIGGWLFQEILKQLEITEDEFNNLR